VFPVLDLLRFEQRQLNLRIDEFCVGLRFRVELFAVESVELRFQIPPRGTVAFHARRAEIVEPPVQFLALVVVIAGRRRARGAQRQCRFDELLRVGGKLGRGFAAPCHQRERHYGDRHLD